MGIHVPSNVPMESTPFKGMEFETDETAYDFYNEYGKKAGFSIRKEYVNKCKRLEWLLQGDLCAQRREFEAKTREIRM